MPIELSANEHVIYEGHPSWRSILSFYLYGTLVALAVGAIAYFASGVGVAIIAFAAIFLIAIVVGMVKRIATRYTITNRKLHIKHGIIARRTQEASLQRVQNVNTEQGMLERILQVGTVDFDTAGTSDSDFSFVGVSQPERVVRSVERAQHEFQELQRGAGIGPMQTQGL